MLKSVPPIWEWTTPRLMADVDYLCQDEALGGDTQNERILTVRELTWPMTSTVQWTLLKGCVPQANYQAVRDFATWCTLSSDRCGPECCCRNQCKPPKAGSWCCWPRLQVRSTVAITRLQLKLSIDETEPVTRAAGDVGRKVSRHRLIFYEAPKL